MCPFWLGSRLGEACGGYFCIGRSSQEGYFSSSWPKEEKIELGREEH